jgi:hypothetical protein
MARSPREDDEDDDLPPRPRRVSPAGSDDRGEAVEPVGRARRPPPRRDADDEEEDRPRPRRRDADEDEEDRPRTRRRRDEDEEEEDDDRPRRRRRRRDAVEKIIPYHNPLALAAYYCGVFSLIPGLALLLGPIAVILGILGIRSARVHERAGGIGHAITGLVLGILTTIANVVVAFIFGRAIGEAFFK